MRYESTRLVDDVVRAIEEEILAGERRPGDRLTVIPLARRFGMSQSTIREALLTLEQRGLVKTNPRRGFFVTRLSAEEAVELCRMRALLEAYAVSVGLPALPNSALAELHLHVAAMGTCVLPGDLSRLIQIDLEFHRIIAEMGGSATLIEGWSNFNGRIGALIMRSVEANQLLIKDVVLYHQEVVDALATRLPALGRRAIILHYLDDNQVNWPSVEAIEQTVPALTRVGASV